MKSRIRVLLAALFFGGALLSGRWSSGAEDFQWTWQKKGGEAPAAKAAEPAASDDAAQADVTLNTEVAPTAAAGRAAGVDPAAYAQLMKDNQELRKQIDDAAREKGAIEKRNADLAKQVKDLDTEIARMGELAKQLKEEKTDAGSPDKEVELETRLSAAEKEKARLEEELANLKSRERQLAAEADKARNQRKVDVSPSVAVAPVRPGSDRFRELERENNQLKADLTRSKDERQDAVKARDIILRKGAESDEKARRSIEDQKRLEQKLSDSEKNEKEQKELIKKYMRQMPEMEKELARLKTSASDAPTGAGSKTEEVQALKDELERRDQRLVKAEKMARLLEDSRARVQKVSLMEKRDLHYNMAVIYAKEGRWDDAEREYLSALKIDPTDADVHHNLGILYEEDFQDRRKAARHYRKYLELNPYGPDVDQVKGWLLRLDME